MTARLKDWAGMRLIRWGLSLIDERRALWLWDVGDLYWRSPRGREVLRRLMKGDEGD